MTSHLDNQIAKGLPVVGNPQADVLSRSQDWGAGEVDLFFSSIFFVLFACMKNGK